MTATNQGTRTVTYACGKLEFFPSTKGDEVLLNDTNILTLLRQYDGKQVQITIQDVGFDSTYHSSNQSASEET